MDFENKNISVSEFFETLNKKRIEMASSGKFSEDEIKEWEDNFFALQFQTKNYLRQHEQYPDLLPEYLNEDAWIPGETIYPAFKELYDYLCGREIGEIALDKVSMLTVAALTRIAVQAAKDAGFDGHREQLVKAVGDTMKSVTSGLRGSPWKTLTEERRPISTDPRQVRQAVSTWRTAAREYPWSRSGRYRSIRNIRSTRIDFGSMKHGLHRQEGKERS